MKYFLSLLNVILLIITIALMAFNTFCINDFYTSNYQIDHKYEPIIAMGLINFWLGIIVYLPALLIGYKLRLTTHKSYAKIIFVFCIIYFCSFVAQVVAFPNIY